MRTASWRRATRSPCGRTRPCSGRLTGAEPARIRAVARTAETPSELPPAPELAAELAGVLGLAAPRPFAELAGDPGSRIVQH